MKIREKSFGTLPGGEPVTEITIENANEYSVSLIPYGATMTAFAMPASDQRVENVTLGYDSIDPYIENKHYFGSIVGRYANRIARGKFSLGGVEYNLALNDGPNHLHGGSKGLSRVSWEFEVFDDGDAAGVKFSYRSRDGEENYPGNADLTVVYLLNQKNQLFIKYSAETDKTTPMNLTNHAYWNLSGAGTGTILNHFLKLNCDRYLPVDESLIPTGEIRSVKGTPLDFTEGKIVGKDIQSEKGGYDSCFVISDSAPESEGGLKLAAQLSDPESGRIMTLFTDAPGIQLYTGNLLENVPGSDGKIYGKHFGLCLEAQNFPDAVNRPEFPDPYLKPGRLFSTTTMHLFSLSD